MAKQLVNIGTSINKGDGDPLRTAFDKINQNFNELYASTTLDLDSIGSNMIPTTDGGFALGSATKQWSDLYVRDFIYIGGTRLQSDAAGNITVDGGSLQIKDVQGDIFADDSTKVFDSATQTFTGKFEGELIGTVAADDSTVLIDGVAGTINAGALTGALPAIDGSALTGVTTAFSNITSTPTTLAGYGITDATSSNSPAFTGIPDFTGSTIVDMKNTAVDFTGSTITGLTVTETDPVVGAITGIVKADGSGNISAAVAGTDYLTTVAFADLTGKPTTLAGYGITDAAGTGNTTFTGTIQFNETVKFEQGVTEAFGTYNSVGGVTVMDLDHGHLFYVTNATGDLTTNFTNLDMAAEYATNITVIINQGATPYEVTAVQIGGAAQTINWQGGSQPTGNANGIDAFSFTILNDGGTYVVLGQMVDFT